MNMMQHEKNYYIKGKKSSKRHHQKNFFKKVKKGVDKREEARYNRRAVNETGQPRDSR